MAKKMKQMKKSKKKPTTSKRTKSTVAATKPPAPKPKSKKPRSLHKSTIAVVNSRNSDIPDKLSNKVGRNMLEALGGKESVILVLEDSNHPKAQALIDRLRSTAHTGENFSTAYSAVGLKPIHVLDIFRDVTQAKVFINALTEADEVMRSLIRRAKDKIIAHEKCNATGKVLDRKTGERTEDECRPCQGSGFVLVDGSLDAQELYFELLDWKKQGGLINIDARKQQANFFGTGSGGDSLGNAIPGVAAGEAPTAHQIIKRADQVFLPPVSSQAALPAPTEETRVTSTIMEGELV